MSAILDTIWKGVAPELQDFFGSLNWTYIIMYAIILYGIKYKVEFDWFNKIMIKLRTTTFSTWIAGFLVGAVFCLFKWLENSPPISWTYISTLLRSWFLVVVFASVFIDGIVKLIKFLGKKVDDKDTDKKES